MNYLDLVLLDTLLSGFVIRQQVVDWTSMQLRTRFITIAKSCMKKEEPPTDIWHGHHTAILLLLLHSLLEKKLTAHHYTNRSPQ